MPPDDLAQAALEPRRRERAGEPQRLEDVVDGAAGDDLVHHPQALLGEGERQGLIAGGMPHGERRMAAARRRHGPRQLRRGRGLEQAAQGEIDAEGGVGARDHLRGEQRMAAELEEVVLAPDPLAAQGLGEDAGQDLFGGVARGNGGALPRPLQHRRRQGPAVHLVVGGQRQGVEADEQRRHHEVGQALLEEGPQRSGVGSFRPHEVGDQAVV